MTGDTVGALFVIFMVVIGLSMLLLYVISLVWLFRDSQTRGKTGCMWLLIAFFTWPFGILAYILLRDKTVIL